MKRIDQIRCRLLKVNSTSAVLNVFNSNLLVCIDLKTLSTDYNRKIDSVFVEDSLELFEPV